MTCFALNSRSGRRVLLGIALAAPALSTPAQAWTFNHFAGSLSPGVSDGTGGDARFYNPAGVAVDSAGNVYMTESGSNAIRKITPAGVVTTLAGLGLSAGNGDGIGYAARFRFPTGIAVDGAGIVYVADTNNHTIRKITPAGVVTTLAGLAGAMGGADGTGGAARFNSPQGVAVDASGTVYVADTSNHTLRKITPAGAVTTLAGLALTPGIDDGTGSGARFGSPRGVAVDSAGVIYVSDYAYHRIRRISPAGVVTTLAGLAAGSANGTGSAARFRNPQGISVDASGQLYVADTGNHTLRKITPAGEVTTLAGLAGSFGSADGTGSAARLWTPSGVAVDGTGTVHVADTSNHALRKVSPAGATTTPAGWAGSYGSADGTGSDARFFSPMGIAIDSAGAIYVSDTGNSTLRKITPAGGVTTLAGWAGSLGSTDGTGSAARFRTPYGVAVDSAGQVYVADTNNQTIRKITPAGVVTTLAGLAGSSGSADGTGSAARFANPFGVAVDVDGNVYVGDSGNYTIRKISPAGAVTTLAGFAGSSGSANGTGGAARFAYPTGVAVDSAGFVYVADVHSIRKITPAGAVTTLAGINGQPGPADGTGSAGRFRDPRGITVDGAGNVYVSEGGGLSNTLRKITPAAAVTTVAGLSGVGGNADGTGVFARFYMPNAIATNAAGNLLYVADTGNHAIRIGAPGLSDGAVIDAWGGCTGAVRQLDAAPQTATGWQWRLIRRPSGSSAAVSSATIRNPTFTPDVGDYHLFQLTASNGAVNSVTTVALIPSGSPAIGMQPPSRSACLGGSTTFSVTAFDAISYQWYKSGGGPIAGATGSSHTLTPVGAGDPGTYYVAITNACGTTLSDNATLSLHSSVPGSPGNSLLASRSGGELALDWAAASGAISYDVNRCAGACVPIVTVATPTVTRYSEPDGPGSSFYTIEARNACGATP